MGHPVSCKSTHRWHEKSLFVDEVSLSPCKTHQGYLGYLCLEQCVPLDEWCSKGNILIIIIIIGFPQQISTNPWLSLFVSLSHRSWQVTSLSFSLSLSFPSPPKKFPSYCKCIDVFILVIKVTLKWTRLMIYLKINLNVSKIDVSLFSFMRQQ